MRDEWKLEWQNNARSMEIRMNKQCAMNGNSNDQSNARPIRNSNDQRMRDEWKLEMIETMCDKLKLEWLNNARSMEIRMTEQCLII